MANILLNLSYFALFSIWAASYWYALPMSPNVVATATLIVYIGSHRSLRLLATEEEGGASSEAKEVLTSTDAAWFPIFGSCALFGLFCAFKYVDEDIVSFVINIYFGFIGVFSVSGTVAPMIESTLLQSKKTYGFKKTLPLIGEVDCMFNSAELVSLIPASLFTYYYLQTKHYMMNNLLGISFSIQSIQRMSIGSYKVGAILLCGLFVYDIFWVFGSESIFGSNVMVTVAKSFDGPIKLLFPKVLPMQSLADIRGITTEVLANIDTFKALPLVERNVTELCYTYVTDVTAGAHSLTEYITSFSVATTMETAKAALTASRNSIAENDFLKVDECAMAIAKIMAPIRIACEGEFSLLGLGDIVIPGLFVAILLRFDAVQAQVKGLDGENQSFAKPYFFWNIVFYALGLMTTLVVMLYFKAAQPALLYLVPACLLASVLPGLIRGNFKDLLAYNEETVAAATEETQVGDKDAAAAIKKDN